MLLLMHEGEIMLEKRPGSGIWGGLWSLPEISVDEVAEAAAEQRYGVRAESLPLLPTLSHAFTHFRLHIKPQPMRVAAIKPEAREVGMVWLPLDDAIGAALPTPVRKLLLQIKKAA